MIGIVPDVAEIQARTYPYLTELVRTHTMAERKSEMIKRAEAFIALPGGIGTLDEITEILSLYSLKIVTGPVIFYNMNGYYEPMKAVLQNILQNGYGREEYFRDVLFAEGLDEIKEAIEWRS